MRSFVAAACAVATLACAEQSFLEAITASVAVDQVSDSASPTSQTITKNKFGCLVEESVWPNSHVEKKITAPLVPYHMDYV